MARKELQEKIDAFKDALQRYNRSSSDAWNVVVDKLGDLIEDENYNEYDGTHPEIERLIDHAILNGGWLYSKLEKSKRNTNKKIRKALGYTIYKESTQ